ncbi:hypothetical protein [Janibacter sp. GXQ6167]|uniref:hypothetical protein n=1 Tax=Janibacter sp. GXQ6167 TaxID=3240791 RepID=UPI003524BD50
MSDWTVIKQWWATLTDDGFVAVSPPTRDRYTQDEGHEDAAEEIADLGLPAGTPYAVWHWQAHGFSRGALTRPNYIYFGGDRSVVAAKLATVPPLFRIVGGDSDDTAFALVKESRLAELEPGDPAAREILAEMIEYHRTAELTDAETSWCRDVVGDQRVDRAVRRDAMLMLAKSGPLDDEVVAFAEDPNLFDGADGNALNTFARRLLAQESPRTDRILQGIGVDALYEDVLESWPSPVAHERLAQIRAAEAARTAARMNPTVWDLDPTSDYALETAMRAYLECPPSADQIAWLRAHFGQKGVNERLLSFGLHVVQDAGALTDDDLDALAKNWRQLAKGPSRSPLHRPGLVSLGIALAESSHPQARTLYERVTALKAKWAIPIRQVLLGWYGDASDLDDLWKECDGSKEACLGWGLLTARVCGVEPAEAFAEGVERARSEGLREGVASHFATAFVQVAQSPFLWCGRFDDRSRVWFERALAVASDPSVPLSLREGVAEQAALSFVIVHPDHVKPTGITAEESADAAARLAAATAASPG